MRVLISLLLLLPVCLLAQQTDREIFGKGWYLSLTLEPRIENEFNLTPYVTASDTLPRSTNPFRSTFPRQGDTILIDGNETIYYREDGLRREVDREQAIFNLLGSIRLHYRMNDRLAFSTGFFYQPTYKEIDRTTDLAELPDNLYYTASDINITYGGLVSDFSYHLRKGKRLRPYVGLQAFFGIWRFRTLRTTKIFPQLSQEIDVTENVRERFRLNTILNFDMDLLAGINYQLNNRFAVGVEASLGQYLIPVPRALQLRYRLGKDRKEQSR